jgi:uncharacterized protein YlbG (UPF0298 family)
MKKLFILCVIFSSLNAKTCNIEYYKMIVNRDEIKALKKELNENRYIKCISKSDCIISIQSLKELDKQLTKAYHKCKNTNLNH